jgi:hypothetical protein
MSTIFVHKTRKVYYHRSNVPERLQPLLAGRAQIWRSLKTKRQGRSQSTVGSVGLPSTTIVRQLEEER